ncbi:MAG: phosphoenolpyruvate--protein phosphotransferase, partial [Isosphaeraceae bacterium]|nr:phosphoenolpyruvate--protein phosphotransferase [Isosphaeraceae bacterium]
VPPRRHKGSPSSGKVPWDPNVSPLPKSKPMQVLRGIAVSPGVAIGPALVFDPRGLRLPPRAIAADAIAAEFARLDRGLAQARAAAEAAEADARQRLGPQYADILAAHARMIADPSLRQAAREKIERERITAEHAVRDVLEGYARRLEDLADRHLAARAADLRDIQQRILDCLTGDRPPVALANPPEPSVALAHDLSPSETAGIDPTRIVGFATEVGGRTSHTAIVAAALEIPAVVGVTGLLERARTCRMAIIDGDDGLVVLDPDPAALRRYRRAAAARAAHFAGLAAQAQLPAVTLDGVRIDLLGNIEFPAEVAACRERGADGIGLYRTEFLYLNTERPPTEDEQLLAYSAVVRAMAGRPVTIRTLDLGADKLVSYQRLRRGGANPSLGLRSLRLSLSDPSLFRTQLRAILRATPLGDVRVMFPLVTNLGEFRRARALLDEVARDLIAEGIPVRADLPVGAMIEVPAAAVMADLLAKEVDFFSIGTNDLIQYTLAVDRTDEAVADLFNAADPAVLRLIAQVVAAARSAGIEVSVCGSMGGEPLYIMLLLGLGLRQLSMPPHQLPEVKRIIRSISLEQARGVAEEALRRDDAESVVALLRSALRRALPDGSIIPQPDDRQG